MVFTTDTLTYKAYTYKSSTDPIAVTEQKIDLVKQADGTYNVAANDVLVKVHAAALNPVDLLLHAFAIVPFMKKDQGIGRDYSGTVAAIGSGAQTTLKVGDKVSGHYSHPFGKGTVAEYVVYDSTVDKNVTTAPSNLSLTDAASWPLVFGTSYMLTSGIDVKDKKVLIFGGATSVGRYVTSLAKHFGAKEVITTNSARSNAIVTELGATSTIDYSQHKSVINPVLESVKDSGKFDFVFDCVGNGDILGHTHDVLNQGAYYRTIVGDSQNEYKDISLLKLLYKLSFALTRKLKSQLGLIHYHYEQMLLPNSLAFIEEGKKLIEDGSVKVYVDSVYSFDNFSQAIERLQSGRAAGKIVIQVEDN